jgi:hypothetical protein
MNLHEIITMIFQIIGMFFQTLLLTGCGLVFLAMLYAPEIQQLLQGMNGREIAEFIQNIARLWLLTSLVIVALRCLLFTPNK